MRRSTLEHRALMRNLPIGAGAAALLLSACSFAPQYKLPDVPTDAQYRASVDRNADAGWGPATPPDRLSRGLWWTRYGDEQLDALAARVESGSPDQIGKAHVCTPVTKSDLVCRLVLDKKKQNQLH